MSTSIRQDLNYDYANLVNNLAGDRVLAAATSMARDLVHMAIVSSAAEAHDLTEDEAFAAAILVAGKMMTTFAQELGLQSQDAVEALEDREAIVGEDPEDDGDDGELIAIAEVPFMAAVVPLRRPSSPTIH